MQKLYTTIVFHSISWLAFGSFLGLLLSLFLCIPSLNEYFSPLSYGRLVPLHLNAQLYGWCSLPLVGLLFKLFACNNCFNRLSLYAVRVWSFSLLCGCISWLSGSNSGKIFLEWKGFSRAIFIANLVFLWICLCLHFFVSIKYITRVALISKFFILLFLSAVPYILYLTTKPELFPPINTLSSGATGSSLVISSLSIVIICILLPPILLRHVPSYPLLSMVLLLSFVNIFLWGMMNHSNSTHYQYDQKVGIVSLLVWIPALYIYYQTFTWDKKYRAWLFSLAFWGVVLVLTAVCMFMPFVLDRYKFTSLIVAHVHIAMAGFLTSLLSVILIYLANEETTMSKLYACCLWNVGLVFHIFALVGMSQLEVYHYGMGFMSPYFFIFQLLRLISGVVMLSIPLFWIYTRRVHKIGSTLTVSGGMTHE